MGIFPETIARSDEVRPGSGSPFGCSRDIVLLIEDDDFVAGLVECILARQPVRVLRAASGEEAEKMFAEHRSDVALAMIDCGLPDTDGRTLCRRLRGQMPQLPVLITSGSDIDIAMLAAEGPTVFLPKPFFPIQVQQQVRSLLGAIS